MLVFDVRRLISTPDVPEWERWRRAILSYTEDWRRVFFEILRNGCWSMRVVEETAASLIAEAGRKHEIWPEFRNGVVLNYTHLHVITRFYTKFLAINVTNRVKGGRKRARSFQKWEKAGKNRKSEPAFPALTRLNRRKWLISRF